MPSARNLPMVGYGNMASASFARVSPPTTIATKVSRRLENLATECGMGSSRVSTHSMRAGCAAALYADGVDPVDIQTWG